MENTSNLSGVYFIENVENNRLYIGSSKNIAERFKTHISKLKNGKHINKKLQNAVTKYGLTSFKFYLVEEAAPEKLLEREQSYIDSFEFKNLYNLSTIAGSGGGNVVSKTLYLLDLEGSIIKEFKSGSDLAIFLGHKLLDYSSINTKSIKNKKYRVVTPEFFKSNREEILSWPKFSNRATYKSEIYWSNKYQIEKEGEKTLFSSQKSLGNFLGISTQRVQQIFKIIDNQGVKKYFHKKTCFYISYVEKKL